MLTAGKAKEEEEENARKDEALMTGLTDVSLAIQAQTHELAKLCATLDQKEQELLTKSTISTQIASTLAEQVRCCLLTLRMCTAPMHRLTLALLLTVHEPGDRRAESRDQHAEGAAALQEREPNLRDEEDFDHGERSNCDDRVCVCEPICRDDSRCSDPTKATATYHLEGGENGDHSQADPHSGTSSFFK